MNNQVKVTATLNMEVEVDPGWIEFVMGGSEGMVDIFLRGYCGYWMEGIDHDPELGWLAYEFGATDRHATRSEKECAIKAWRGGEKLPEHFHALNLEVTKKSWVEGIKNYGLAWYGNGDGNTYDCVIQETLLGELTYG